MKMKLTTKLINKLLNDVYREIPFSGIIGDLAKDGESLDVLLELFDAKEEELADMKEQRDKVQRELNAFRIEYTDRVRKEAEKIRDAYRIKKVIGQEGGIRTGLSRELDIINQNGDMIQVRL